MLTERKRLEALRAKMAAIACKNGSLDPWWDVIADIDDVLNGKEGIVFKTVPEAVEAAARAIEFRRQIDSGQRPG